MAVLFTLLLAFSLSVVIAITYYKTTVGPDFSSTFLQALILSPIVAAMIIQAIGDSVAIGLGLLGALAVIRFRTNFKNPRNIIFLFASLAIGISCGVFGYTIAIVGTLTFSILAFALFLSPIGKHFIPNGILTARFTEGTTQQDQLQDALSPFCERSHFKALRTTTTETDQLTTYEYQVRLLPEISEQQLFDTIRSLPGNSSVRIDYDNQNETFS
ncbi:MAG: DUF4956 domain-containing protein [Bacteroidota bacterium]